MATILLESRDLSKTYQAGDHTQTVLKNITIQIKKGEFVSVMGPSGSGKSTLLYSISGMDRVSEGRVVFAGQELTALPEKALAHLRLTRMGFVFQQSHLLKNLGLLDNIVLSAYLAKKRGRGEINRSARELMARAGIAELADRDVTQASGGQLQRVAICRALINQPDMLFGDEPTGALNSRSAGEIMDLFATIHEAGTTIMLVTHDAKVAARTERVLYMLDGNVVAELELGTFDGTGEDMKAREEKLAKWLNELGF